MNNSYEDLAVCIFFGIESSSSESLRSSFVVGFLEILILRGCAHLERCLNLGVNQQGYWYFLSLTLGMKQFIPVRILCSWDMSSVYISANRNFIRYKNMIIGIRVAQSPNFEIPVQFLKIKSFGFWTTIDCISKITDLLPNWRKYTRTLWPYEMYIIR